MDKNILLLMCSFISRTCWSDDYYDDFVKQYIKEHPESINRTPERPVATEEVFCAIQYAMTNNQPKVKAIFNEKGQVIGFVDSSFCLSQE